MHPIHKRQNPTISRSGIKKNENNDANQFDNEFACAGWINQFMMALVLEIIFIVVIDLVKYTSMNTIYHILSAIAITLKKISHVHGLKSRENSTCNSIEYLKLYLSQTAFF